MVTLAALSAFVAKVQPIDRALLAFLDRHKRGHIAFVTARARPPFVVPRYLGRIFTPAELRPFSKRPSSPKRMGTPPETRCR